MRAGAELVIRRGDVRHQLAERHGFRLRAEALGRNPGMFPRRKFRPMLRQLKIQECGLHAFRHANTSLMDGYLCR